jgi:ABC-type phosphate/phosphonate transport system substrate-binding protein
MIALAAEAGAAEKLTLAIVPYYAPEKIYTLFAPFAEYLSAATGTPWELKIYVDHDSLVKGISAGEVSAAFLGPVPFGRVARSSGVRPLVVSRGPDGTPWYRSVIVTSGGSVRTLKEVRGRSFGFFEGSTAAHVVPAMMLERAGIQPGEYKAVFLKGQDRIVDAVLKREIAAAGVKKALHEKFRGMGLDAILESDPLPNFCICATHALPLPVEKKLVASLLALNPKGNPADRDRMKGWDDEVRYGFVRPPDGYADEAGKLAAAFERLGKK